MYRKGSVLIWTMTPPASSGSVSLPEESRSRCSGEEEAGRVCRRPTESPKTGEVLPKTACGDSPNEREGVSKGISPGGEAMLKEETINDHVCVPSANTDPSECSHTDCIRKDTDTDGAIQESCQVKVPTSSSGISNCETVQDSSGTGHTCCQSRDQRGQTTKSRKTVVTLHEDIIGNKFWGKYPYILV